MWPTAGLASALVRLVLVLTWVCGDGDGGGGDGDGGGGDGDGDGGDGGGDGGDGGEGGDSGGSGGGGGGGAGQEETVPETPVRVIAQEQTMPPLT